jgi:hypothetical protein
MNIGMICPGHLWPTMSLYEFIESSDIKFGEVNRNDHQCESAIPPSDVCPHQAVERVLNSFHMIVVHLN